MSQSPALENYFSPDYVTARERFCAAARAARAECYALPLAATGPQGEALTIDIAWVGSQRPKRLFLHTSGVHGVEAYAGAAVQLALLAALPSLGEGDAMVLVHILNPYGMAWSRRTNENNVDLNRNFLCANDEWRGAHPVYRRLERFLNPPSPPANDAFRLRAAAYALALGFHHVKQAIAEGQYEFPRGLFYGGRALEQGPRVYLEWLASHRDGIEQLLALDVHTGLGRRGTDTLLLDGASPGVACDALERALGRPLVDAAKGRSDAYVIRGGLGGALVRLFPDARARCVLQEFGTYAPLTVLHALREENRCHHHETASASHPAKLRLRETLCPPSTQWRRLVIRQGTAVARTMSGWLFRQEGA